MNPFDHKNLNLDRRPDALDLALLPTKLWLCCFGLPGMVAIAALTALVEQPLRERPRDD